jgi:TolB protein
VPANSSADHTHTIFTYNQNDDSDLYYLNTDNSSSVQLMRGEDDDVHPVWPPENTRIASVPSRDGDWQIFVFDLGSCAPQQFTQNQEWDSFPTWSPGGRRIVF